MNKKVISIMIAIVLTVTMIVPTMAGNGDNTGEDTFGWNVNITNADLYGDYTLGTVKVFKTELWTGQNKITNVKREMKITGVAEVADLEYRDDSRQWKPISEFNVAMPELLKDVGREYRVTFNTVGKYTVEFNIYDGEDKVILSSKKVINVTETGIEKYIEPETTTEEPTVETTVEITSELPTDETTKENPTEVPTDETPADTTSVAPIEPTTPDTTSEAPTDPTIPDTSTAVAPTEPTTPDTTSEDQTEPTTPDTTSEVSTVPTTTVETPSENLSVETTTAVATKVPATTLAKTKIKKASAKKASGRAKISIKKIRKAKKYQVQIATSKKFKKKTILVKKTVKKIKFTIKSKKIKKKKKLYVRARAYAVIGKTKCYGKWSNGKKIRIK